MIDKAREYLGVDFPGRLKIMEYYNRHCFPLVDPSRRYRIQPHDDWCAAFVSVVAHQCGLAGDEFPYEVSCYYQMKGAQQAGTFYASGEAPKPHDLILFDWNGNGVPNHVGFVVRVSDTHITSIEGNRQSTVGFRTIKRDSPSVVGFVAVPYDDPARGLEGGQDAARIDAMARSVIRGQYGTGSLRQRLLGADYAAVQARVNTLLKQESPH